MRGNREKEQIEVWRRDEDGGESKEKTEGRAGRRGEKKKKGERDAYQKEKKKRYRQMDQV